MHTIPAKHNTHTHTLHNTPTQQAVTSVSPSQCPLSPYCIKQQHRVETAASPMVLPVSTACSITFKATCRQRAHEACSTCPMPQETGLWSSGVESAAAVTAVNQSVSALITHQQCATTRWTMANIASVCAQDNAQKLSLDKSCCVHGADISQHCTRRPVSVCCTERRLLSRRPCDRLCDKNCLPATAAY